MPPIQTETSAAELASALESFLAEHPRAAVLEDGRVLFEMQTARYALSAEHGRCVLHLWSEDRNLVRTVMNLDARKNVLRIETRRFGQTKPQTLQLVPDRDTRTPTTREATRKKFLRMLERVMTRAFPDLALDSLGNATDLEHSFGPAYARGVLVRGPIAWAVIAVNAEETQATVDGALTLGILWLAYCREHSGGRRVFEGLKVIVPAGAAAVTRGRMAWLNPSLAKWELYELDERCETVESAQIGDEGNLDIRLVHSFSHERALERSQATVDRLLALLPVRMKARTEIRPLSSTEISFRLHGLEFARIRHGLVAGSFDRQDTITFGAGANETPLTHETEDLFRELIQRVHDGRFAGGSVRNPLYRLQPERWLESELRQGLAELEPSIREEFVYVQVPAFAGGDRGMIDLLSVTRSGRLMVLELKADEDLHLPLQGLDYWLRVRQVHAKGELQTHGYFNGVELSPEPPLLMLVAPALRIHPANETVLRYLKPEVDWTLIALDEHWRQRRRVIFRKRSER
ncbi:hypothetical protein H7849_02055 [Alloacidobacterium dinghuense]|uniref:DUF91 domain-containing protein n=1 Tax=Alloacidobacterium dinghuense TaxID=2763107 RepID=A0A7G8BJT7_9BACT|nr:hypothetical protein [Alloacidobacterium dinghuense]QNI32807.1 hypothetical protein H7849_02055 [Alloacidobacterium dinghuense]